MIQENVFLEQIESIWKENNKGYIGYECNQRSIRDNNMLKIVYVEENIVLGYCVLYFEKDFCELEEYPNNIAFIPDKVAYIWEIVTNKKYVKKGVATKILNYIKDKYNGYSIYSCIDLSNTPSLKLHLKMNFDELYKFYKDGDEYVMMELKIV